MSVSPARGKLMVARLTSRALGLAAVMLIGLAGAARGNFFCDFSGPCADECFGTARTKADSRREPPRTANNQTDIASGRQGRFDSPHGAAQESTRMASMCKAP